MTPDLMDLAIEGLKKTLTSGAYTLEKSTRLVTFNRENGTFFHFAVV